MGKILITGGGGFIGANVAAYFLKKNRKVVVYDNLSRKNSIKNLSWLKSLKKTGLKIVIGDVRDFNRLRREVKQTELIFHLAAQVAVTKSIKNPREDFEVNAWGTFNILEAARRSGHKPILIYSSTNKVYGELQGMERKVSESQPLDFCSPYGCSKGSADQYVRDYQRIFALPTVVFRQSCIYGSHQYGDEDQGWVAHFCWRAGKNLPITIFGDGKQVRDILWIEDLIDAYELAVRNINKVKGQIFNIGGGLKNKISLLELIAELERILGRKIKYSLAGKRQEDQEYYVSDISKIKRVLNWQPKVDKKEGIRKLWQWIKSEA